MSNKNLSKRKRISFLARRGDIPPRRISFIVSTTKVLPNSIYKEAWAQLYNAFGERGQIEEMELMNNVLQGVKLDFEERQNVSDKTPD